ncbi:MAG: glycosyltransferase [Clostridia bacterium]
MRKIMFFRPLYYIGGTEIAILNLIKNLRKYDIYIGYTDENSGEDILNKYSNYAKVVKVDENFNEEIDILVLCSPNKKALEIDNLIKRKKNILWFHYFGSKENAIFTDERFYSIVDSIVAVSETTKEMLLSREYGSRIKDKIQVIYNIMDVEEIIEKSKQEIELDLNHELILVSVGRICYEKGLGRQLELAKLLKKHNVDFKWYIIGGNYYAEKEKEIKDKYQELGDYFVFTGFIDNPYNIISKSDYLVLLSDVETWGLVITEAKILGVPCIVTDFDAAFEQIKDNVNGLILSRDDIDSYEKKIDLIINKKKVYKENLLNFKWDNEEIINQWKQIFK